MDPAFALLFGLPVPLLDSFGKADNVLPFVMLEQLQRRAPVRPPGDSVSNPQPLQPEKRGGRRR